MAVIDNNPVIDNFVVYKLWGDGPRRLRPKSRGEDVILEEFRFDKFKNGDIGVDITFFQSLGRGMQSGMIPEEYFSLSWAEFIDNLFEDFRVISYSVSKEEVMAVEGLKEFLMQPGKIRRAGHEKKLRNKPTPKQESIQTFQYKDVPDDLIIVEDIPSYSIRLKE